MKFSILRFLLLQFTLIISLESISVSILADTPSIQSNSIQKKLAILEASSGGRIGLSAINTANVESSIQYRAEERFPFCSTSKVMGVAAVLKQSMKNPALLQEKMIYQKEDLVAYSPITEKHLADGMTIAELSLATITRSDNTAINLLMKKLGGPKAVTAFARSIGDNKFRLDRWEPELNTAIPGDIRDTTTPSAMANSLEKLILGDVLAQPQREQLQTWLKNNTTGNFRIRAGVPKSWIVGDKTGSGDYGTTNDIGILWPPKCPPIVVAIYFTQNKKDAIHREEIIASITRMLISELVRTDQCLKTSNS